MNALPEYEYWGLMARSWDLLRGDTSNWDDRFFYLEGIARYGQPVLDVGCGTGRLLLDFLQHGFDAEGVDNSPEMLALLEKKAAALDLHPTTYLQSMETLDLPRRYRLILVPSSSFQLITDRVLARQAMERLVAHLLPGGVLAMPFMTLWRPGEPTEIDWHQREMVRPEDGATVRHWNRSVYDPQTECESTEDRYEVILNGRVNASEYHRRSPATRSYTQDKAIGLYESSGLEDVRIYSNFSWQPVKESDTVFTAVGVRAH